MPKQNTTQISRPVIKRLPRYHRYLRDLIQHDVTRISSGQLAKAMSLTASQIRQDLNCFGGFGQQGYGYNVQQLYSEIESILKVDRSKKAILVGAGNLGHTIATHVNFKRCGFDLVGIFDKSESLIGTPIGGLTVQDSQQMNSFIRQQEVEMAILCIPRAFAPTLAKELAENGIRGFWNFSQSDLIIDGYPDIYVENIRLIDSLMTLRYHL